MKKRAWVAVGALVSAGTLAFGACGGGGGAPAPTATSRPTSAATTTGAATSSGGAGDPARGKALFTGEGTCFTCHTIKGVPQAVGQVGPELSANSKEAGIGTRAATRKPGLTAEQYIEESIRQPNAFVVPGFQAGLMPQLPLSDAQVKDLVAFLITVK